MERGCDGGGCWSMCMFVVGDRQPAEPLDLAQRGRGAPWVDSKRCDQKEGRPGEGDVLPLPAIGLGRKGAVVCLSTVANKEVQLAIFRRASLSSAN